MSWVRKCVSDVTLYITNAENAACECQVGKNKVTRLESGNEIVFGPASSTFVNDFRYIFQSKTVAIPTIKGDGGGIHALYDIRDPIGKGSFATVKRGIERLTGKVSSVSSLRYDAVEWLIDWKGP